MMKKYGKSIAAILAAGILTCMLGAPAGAAEQTPTPTVTVSYNINTYASAWTTSQSTTYYATVGAPDTITAGAPADVSGMSAYWQIVTNGANDKTVSLILKPGTLLAVTGEASFSTSGVQGFLNESNAIKFIAAGESGGLGTPYTGNNQTNYTHSGDTAVVCPGTSDTYYVYTSDGWNQAEAKSGSYYYEHFYSDDVNEPDTALNAANNQTGSTILLLASVDVTSSSAVDADVSIYCCNSSVLTVTTGGNLALNGKVFDSAGSSNVNERYLCVENGGVINDQGGNAIYAYYNTYNPGTSGASAVTGNGTTLSFEGGSKDATVDIQGTFAKLGGYFSLMGDPTDTVKTIVNDTLSAPGASGNDIAVGDAIIVSRGSAAELTVNGGRVYDLCPFPDGYSVKLSGGYFFVKLGSPTQVTCVTGTGAGLGNLNVISGTTKVYGSMAYLNLYGTTDTQYGGWADLYGTAQNAAVQGSATLTVKSGGSVTNTVTGTAFTSGSDNYYGTLNAEASGVHAEGIFRQVGGTVTMSGDLKILDASTTKRINCSDPFTLEVMGAGNLTSLPYEDFLLAGTFGSVVIHNVDITLENSSFGSVSIVNQLIADHADITVCNGAQIGVISGRAMCSIKDGIFSFVNSPVYARIEGLSSDDGSSQAEVHIADNCYSTCTSCVGAYGTFRGITGHVYTCGDLTVNGTADNGTYGQDQAIVTGGMTLYDDSGMKWLLKLNDSASDATVLLADGKDGSGTLQSPGFSGIRVEDSAGNGNKVSLTMEKVATLPINLGSSADPQTYEANGLYVSGDASTVTDLRTNEIYGSGTGVVVTGTESSPITVTLSGSDPADLKTVIGASGSGAQVSYGTLNMTDYAITGAVNGVTVQDASIANLTDVQAAGSDVSGIGLAVSGASTVNLGGATVSGKTGIRIADASLLNLKDTIAVIGENYGINLLDGTVTNHTDTGYNGSGTVTVTGPGTGICALFAAKGSVDLDGYTFDARVANGSGVVTADDAVVTVRLSYRAADKTNAYLWGYQNGLVVGRQTVMTLSDYHVYGSNSADQATSTSGNAGALVYGILQLEGTNGFLGFQYGVYAWGGTVTNYKSGDAWVSGETDASPAGTGTIWSGTNSSSYALYMKKNESVEPSVTLGKYSIASGGGSGAYSCGLYAGAGLAYLSGDSEHPAAYSVTGTTGAGICVAGANVTVCNMALETTSAHSGRVESGVLNLGTGVTLGTNSGGAADIMGASTTNAELFVISGNSSIRAQGAFENLTGYVTTSGDLTVAATDGTDAYDTTNYGSALSVLGGGATHHLTLGTGKITATLADGGSFASVKIDGTDAIRQAVTVAGGLTVSNSDRSYGFSATNADVTFSAADDGEADFIRSITASGSGAAALTAGIGAKLYLTDTVNLTGVNGIGLQLTGDAVVTNLKKNGDWVTAYATEGTAQSSGTITAGTAADVSGTALLLLGNHTYTGTACGLNAADNAEVFLITDTAKQICASADNGHAICINVGTEKRVTVSGYSVTADRASTVLVNNGLVTFNGGSIATTSQTAKALEIAGCANGLPSVTLAGAAVVNSNAQDCVSLQGADGTHQAVLTVKDTACVANTTDHTARTIVGGSNAKLYVSSSSTDAAAVKAKGTFEVIQCGSGNGLVVDDGAALTVAVSLTAPSVQVKSGSLTNNGLWTAGSVKAGSTKVASFDRASVSNLTGTLSVGSDTITAFPTPVLSGATYQGWYVKGGNGTVISSGTYPITGGETLCAKYQVIVPMGGGGGGTSSYGITALVSGTDAAADSKTWGSVSLQQTSAGAGTEVTVTPVPGTSFLVNSVSVSDSDKKAVEVTNHGDGTYSFVMPSSDVSVNAEFAPVLGTPQTTPAPTRVMRAYHKIYLNGKEVRLDAYNINYNNYFKLRDIADLLNDTGNKFSISVSSGQIHVRTGEAYLPVGGECVIGADRSATCVVSSWNLMVNGEARYLKCYNLGQNNYFQIRELGALLGFDVAFDAVTSSVQITTH